MHQAIRDVLEGRSRFCLLEGDALALLREIPTASVHALIVDGPYSSGGFTRGDRTSSAKTKYSKGQLQDFGGDNRDQLSFVHWCAIWYGDALRATVPGGAICTFTDWRQLAATCNSVQAGGWIMRGVWPWVKHNSRPQMGRFSSDAEFVVWGTNGASPDSEEIGCLAGHVFAPSPPTSERVHLTQKAVEAMDLAVSIVPRTGIRPFGLQDVIDDSDFPVQAVDQALGGIVLDPFCGSGTTGVSALRRGLRFIGFERDAHYAQVARDRLAAEAEGSNIHERRAGQLALLGDSDAATVQPEAAVLRARCDECAAEFSCFNGSAPCCKVPK